MIAVNTQRTGPWYSREEGHRERGKGRRERERESKLSLRSASFCFVSLLPLALSSCFEKIMKQAYSTWAKKKPRREKKKKGKERKNEGKKAGAADCSRLYRKIEWGGNSSLRLTAWQEWPNFTAPFAFTCPGHFNVFKLHLTSLAFSPLLHPSLLSPSISPCLPLT